MWYQLPRFVVDDDDDDDEEEDDGEDGIGQTSHTGVILAIYLKPSCV